MSFLALILLVALCRADQPAFSYNASNIQLLRIDIVPALFGTTYLTMSCSDVASFEFCGVALDFFCSGWLSNANMTTSMSLYITDENAVTELQSEPLWNLTTDCGGSRSKNGGEVYLSGVMNHVAYYVKTAQWVDYCGTFNITMWYVQTTVENQIYPTEIIYKNNTESIPDNEPCFECPTADGLSGGILLLIIGGSLLGLFVLAILLFFLSRAYGHPIIRLNRRKKTENLPEESHYADISSRIEVIPASRKSSRTEEQTAGRQPTHSIDSGVFSVRPSPIAPLPRESFSLPSRRTSLAAPSQVENHVYLESKSLPLRRPSRLSVGSDILDEVLEARRQSLHGYELPDSLAGLTDRLERTRRFLPRKLSNQSGRERLNSLGSIQEM